MKPKQGLKPNGWLIIALVSLMLLAGLIMWIVEDVRAQDTEHYLILHSRLNFEYSNRLPYVEEGHMCWNADAGFCDIEGDPVEMYRVIEHDTLAYTIVYLADNGCFALTMQKYLGEDGQPHVQRAQWVSCEEDEDG